MKIEIDIELLEKIAPSDPINQDEMGGCVWCRGKPPGSRYGYATSDPRHHKSNCPWLEIRELILSQR